MDDLEDLAPESEEEFERQQRELIEETRQEKQQLEQKQNEALQAIAEGEELEEFETVSLGELELRVKGWIPGDTTDTVQEAMQLAESEDMEHVRQSMSVMLEALDDMTADSDFDMRFWREYYTRYGPSGMITAVETILEPAVQNMEQKKEGVDGFRSNVER
jgi:hypothetical protein